MNIELQLTNSIINAVQELYGQVVDEKSVQVQKTRKDFEGDFTLVVFPLLRVSKKPPEQTANEIGGYLSQNVKEVCSFNVIKGFLNLSLDKSYWISFLTDVGNSEQYGFVTNKKTLAL